MVSQYIKSLKLVKFMFDFEFNNIIDNSFAIFNFIELYLVSNVKQDIIYLFDFDKIYCIFSGLFLQESREKHLTFFCNDNKKSKLNYLMFTLSILIKILKHLFFS